MTRRVLLAILLLLPLARAVSTYHVFNQTHDEPMHVVCGWEWLTTRSDYRDLEHPPLARAMFAIEPALRGVTALDEHNEIRFLNSARAANLVFLIITLIVVTSWTRRLFGDSAALIALGLLGALPPVLAHAALATTDCAAMAMTTLALYVVE